MMDSTATELAAMWLDSIGVDADEMEFFHAMCDENSARDFDAIYAEDFAVQRAEAREAYLTAEAEASRECVCGYDDELCSAPECPAIWRARSER